MTQSPVAAPVFTRYSVKSTPEASPEPPPWATVAVPTMPCQRPCWTDEWSLHTQVQRPRLVERARDRRAAGLRSCVVTWVPAESGASPGSITHTSCGNAAVSSGKFHRTTSPDVALTVFGFQLEALGVDVMGLRLAAALPGSVADSVTPTGPWYVPPAPGCAGSSACVVTGGGRRRPRRS